MADGSQSRRPSPQREIAQCFFKLLTGEHDPVVRVRFIHDSERKNPAAEREGTISQLWDDIEDFQRRGYGVFYFLNKVRPGLGSGYATDTDVILICALATDHDTGLPDVWEWHIHPPIIVNTSRILVNGRETQKGQALWPVADCPVTEFKPAQLRLAENYNADRAISNPSRVLRLPGTLHLKAPNNPQLVTFEDFTDSKDLWEYMRSLPNILAGLPPAEEENLNSKSSANESYKSKAGFNEPAYAALAAERCAQLRHFKEIKGDISEPLWYANLGVLAHCTDGERLAQEWSNGYPGYTPEETAKKFFQAHDRAGPTTCARFQSLNPNGCKGCLYKVTSPIMLGREQNHSRLPPEIDALVNELAALSIYEYDLRRTNEAEHLSIRVSILDDLVKQRRPPKPEEESAKNGKSLSLPNPEPWPHEVDGAELLGAMVEEFRRYLILPDGAAEALALWILHSHAFIASAISPRLLLSSPVKRCGKTTTLRIIGALVPKRLMASNISAAAMFRTVEMVRPTLLVDEADSFLKDNEQMRGIINSGHAKDGVVIRTIGEDHEPRTFSAWCPLLLASIGKLAGTIEDRSIIISMRRRKPDEKIERLKPKDEERLAGLCRKAARWAADNMQNLKDADPEISEELNDRATDNWRPLIAIADRAGKTWPERSRRTALILSGESVQGDQTISIQLLSDIRDIFIKLDMDKIPSGDLCQRLGAMEGKPWAEWYRGKQISQTQIARQLAPYEIKSKDIRLQDGKVLKGYELGQFHDTFSRYLP